MGEAKRKQLQKLEKVADKAKDVIRLMDQHNVIVNKGEKEEAIRRSYISIADAINVLRMSLIELEGSVKGMDFNLSKWDGNPGFLCLPRVENVPRPEGEYGLVSCPRCGSGCYLTAEARTTIAEAGGRLYAVCTVCALEMSQGSGKSEQKRQ